MESVFENKEEFMRWLKRAKQKKREWQARMEEKLAPLQRELDIQHHRVSVG